MNPKAKGEKAQRIVIGELAKFDIDVAIPLSDNLPFDLIVIRNGKLFKLQVKSSTSDQKRQVSGSREFALKHNDWYRKTTYTYTKQDTDVMALTDGINVYLLLPKDFSGRSSFSIRCEISKNNQNSNCNLHEHYILSEERIKQVFG